ncbi:MAG: holo-ACP synthase [Gammaproteobacteria bacterium]
MIYGIGTDIVQVARMAADLERYGERFAHRILTPSELEEFQTCIRPPHFLAKRFAAKEAAAKALGTGFRDGLTLHQIGVTHDHYGRPLLEYTGAAAALCRSHDICHSHLSLADEEDYAIAFVTLVTDGSTP